MAAEPTDTVADEVKRITVANKYPELMLTY